VVAPVAGSFLAARAHSISLSMDVFSGCRSCSFLWLLVGRRTAKSVLLDGSSLRGEKRHGYRGSCLSATSVPTLP
jgi:hypothetical protein